ncbi:MAG: BlaI/MecI/CopY family transcriptional regulator [Eubacteriales bacterium]|nr:BlaI/MecI/CopY family transcriptional regulator [Eubacteriales bacterium]
MAGKFGLSETEYMIMTYFWDTEREMMVKSVREHFSEKGTLWATQTVKTFLENLVKKGSLTFRKQGHQKMYYAAMDRMSYATLWLKKIVEQNFDNGMDEFILTFSNLKNDLTEAQKEELKKIWDE